MARGDHDSISVAQLRDGENILEGIAVLNIATLLSVGFCAALGSYVEEVSQDNDD